ncbi:sulfatase-like hydrolase/transferase [Shigella sonnei]
MAKDNVVYFPDTASCGTATAVSAPCMFSDMPREHYKEELAQHQEGVLDIIQRAGINACGMTTMAAVRRLRLRTSPEYHRADLPGQCINGERYDEVLFHGLEEASIICKAMAHCITHDRQPRPSPIIRHPPQFRKFTQPATNQIPDLYQRATGDTYDNTLVYVTILLIKRLIC